MPGGEAVAFVAGATGYTGREVVAALRERGVRTIAHVRSDSQRVAEFRARFTALGAELDTTAWEPDAITETFRRLRPTHVFALLGTTRSRARNEGMSAQQAYARVDYGLTKWLMDAALAVGNSPRFVYLSAAGVDPESKNDYVAARARTEQSLRNSGLSYTIARPSFITGPDREEERPFERIGSVVVDGVLALAGVLGARKLRDRYRSTTAATLARALVRVAFDPAWATKVAQSEDLR
ncbi:MAG TPA: NAD(P)H-binding protein [Nannocystaceae bacterium]|nr:NAD(P)H-binding protein [Nannocystaceae bacterium]